MRIDTDNRNLAFIGIIEDSGQIITLDANFLIPPDRNSIVKKRFSFIKFKELWLDPLFNEFKNLAIHEAVYEELVASSAKKYIDSKITGDKQNIIIHRDSSLSDNEKTLRDAIELKIVPRTQYNPDLDNKNDRGEVKSLAYVATKNLLLFASNDNNALKLIEKADIWSTGLENVKAVRMYELIYYLYKKGLSSPKSLKMLYKYQYYLTEREKSINREWGKFIEAMGELYEGI